MTFLEELRTVLGTLRTQRMRAFLTLFGIILGVGTLVVLSSALEGSGKYMERRMQQATGEDIITVSKRWWDEGTGKKGRPLDRFDSRALARDDHLGGAMVLNRYAMRVPWGDRWGQSIWVLGTQPEALRFYDLEVDQGRYLSQADDFAHAKVAVLGAQTLEKLVPGKKGAAVLGQEIKLKGQRFRVIGVLKPKPAMGKGSFWTWDTSVVVPESSYVDRFAQAKDLSEIVVKAEPESIERLGFARLAYTVRAVVLARHEGVENFRVTDPVKDAAGKAVVGLIAGSLQVAIAGVCLLVGGINVMNILLVSVTQRTREIGIRRAVGATRGSIMRQFLTEAAILAAVGGLSGVVGGAAIAWLLSAVLTMTLGYWPFIFMPTQAILGMGAALLTGLVFGWYPARQAANLDPIECLRYE